MTLTALTASTALLSLSVLAVSSHPGGYWWMGRDGAFDGPAGNNQLAEKSPSIEISPGYGSAGGYYGKPSQGSSSSSQSSSPAEFGQDLPGSVSPVLTEAGESW